ncbi:MAG: hypothetical protein ACOZE5_11150 [Verrucomicrobiota bacterium]
MSMILGMVFNEGSERIRVMHLVAAHDGHAGIEEDEVGRAFPIAKTAL